MKTKTFFFATFFLVAGLYSCNDQSNEAPGGGVDTGESTYLDLSFSFPKGNVETRSLRAATTGDDNASLLETALNTIDVYIFNSNTGMMVKHQELEASDFTQQPSTNTEDVWKAKATIGTTTGQKTVFVGVNLPRTFAQGLKDASLTVFNDNVHSLNMAQLVTDKGLAMFSAKGMTSDLKPIGEPGYNTNNILKIPVKRLVAKVTVEESPNMKVNAPGKIQNLTFAINNINKKFYLVTKVDGSDPNYGPNTWNIADFYNATNTPGVAGDGYIKVNPADIASVSDLKSLYTTENTSVNHWKEEITRATVRATFVPDKITQRSGSGFVQVPNSSSTPTTFWSVLLQNGYKDYFLYETIATAYAAANPGSFKSEAYKNGYCYYDMFLNKDGNFNGTNVSSKRWDVFRNDYYRCRITSILAPGRPNENVVDPKTPPAVETDINYEIDILFWNLVTDDYNLEP